MPRRAGPHDLECCLCPLFRKGPANKLVRNALTLNWIYSNGKMARLTGLEPATLGVTGRYSNQLSYNRAIYVPRRREMVGRERLELPTSSV